VTVARASLCAQQRFAQALTTAALVACGAHRLTRKEAQSEALEVRSRRAQAGVRDVRGGQNAPSVPAI